MQTGQELVSDLPLNLLLVEHPLLNSFSDFGDVWVEPEGDESIRFRRLPKLAEVDAQERARKAQQPPEPKLAPWF